MKNKWIRMYEGFVLIEIHGNGTERFINEAIRKEVDIWEIRRISDHYVEAKVNVKDALRLRHIARYAQCKIRFKQRKGWPFFLLRLFRRSGIIFGMVTFFIILFLCSNLVWTIKIEGASPKIEHEIRQTLKENGVKKGAFMFFLPTPEELQRRLTNQVDDVTWIGVKVNGTTFTFQVVEKKLAEKEKAKAPQHLIATKKAIVTDLFVKHGQPMVGPNEFVQKGQLLVSGIIGEDEKTRLVAAEGVVYGEIWYKSSIEVPLQSTFKVFTEEHMTKHEIKIGQFEIPFWGWNKTSFKNVTIHEVEKPLYLLKRKLPFTYVKKEIFETEKVVRTFTEKEAANVGKLIARRELKNNLPKNSEIKMEKVLHQSTSNGKVKLIIHYEVIEEISKEQPIVKETE